MTEKVRFCPTCRLNNPPGARRCVCGANLVPAWELQAEREQRQTARRRTMDSVWQVLAACALGGVLYAVYLYAGAI